MTGGRSPQPSMALTGSWVFFHARPRPGEGELMTAWTAGDRVRLVACTDEYTRLEPGLLGTVDFIDDTGTVFVRWDDGHRLGMVYEAGDRIVPAGRERK